MSHKQLQIEKHVHGGFGLCHDSSGKVTLLTGGIAGEQVTAKIHSHSKTMDQGRVVEVITASPTRKDPPCSYYHRCGGCDFQHIQYSEQLKIKGAIVSEILTRSGVPQLMAAAHDRLLPPIASKNRFSYRQRIRLQVDKEQSLGFFQRRSNRCVAIDSCLLAVEEINRCLQKLHTHQSLKILLRRMEALELLFNPCRGTVCLLLHMAQKPRPTDIQHGRKVVETVGQIENLFFHGKDFAPTGTASLAFTLPPLPPHTRQDITLSWETGGFCQVNIHQNQILIETVLQYCACGGEDSILDLFCGMGNFSIPLAVRAKSVLGIEGQGAAIRSAKQNSKTAQLANTVFQKRPVHEAAIELVAAGSQFDIVVIDPPRQGAPDLAGALAQLTKKRLVYISCDPATLCRDLAALLENNFQLQKLQPIDMFPQTHHIECVALLEKSPEKH